MEGDEEGKQGGEGHGFAELIFIACMFIGAGIGLAFDRPEVGGCIGMGIGFLSMGGCPR